ncbi:MAG TPA: arginase family protein [Dongiaceae bacterium]|nr:arginase family protein [Dongiaceae bacterium]
MIARHPWGDLADPAAGGPASASPADVLILGLPWDGSVCLRPGAAEAPAALRAISTSSMAISERGELVRRDDLRVVDLGDLAPDDPSDRSEAGRRRYLDRVERDTARHLRTAAHSGRDAFLLAIGGDHSVSIGLTRAFSTQRPEGYGLIAIDAHPDLFDTYDGSPLSHACPMRRALDSTLLRPEHLLLLGTRSYNAVELDFMREQGIRCVTARDLSAIGTDAVVALARERMQGVGGIYLSIDIDGADPSCAPGTGAPVAGGPSSRQVIDLVRGLLEALPVRAMDLVEIAPPIDPSGITLALALQIVFETFAVLAAKRRAPTAARPR